MLWGIASTVEIPLPDSYVNRFWKPSPVFSIASPVSSSPSWNGYKKEFTKTLEGFRYSRGIREIFSDWLEIGACAIHQEPYHLGLVLQDEAFRTVEAQYMEAVKKYSREELEAFATLLGITKIALGESKGDFLGSIYMELELGQDRSGEFFTPYPVSLMMAKMSLTDMDAHIEEKGFITLSEPACGGGGMLIAVAQAMEEAGHDPRETLFFEATDISKLCCDMAYLQTSVMGLSGIVRHGDTLRVETWNSRFTPMCRVYPDRTNSFLDSLAPAPDAAPAPDPASELAPAAHDKLVEKEPDSTMPEIAIVAKEVDRLSQLDESYVQGRLF